MEIRALKNTAKLSGILYLSLLPLGILGIIYVPDNLIVTNDISTTINNIIENETLFRWSIIAALTVQLINIILVIQLYKILQHIHKIMAYFMVIFSLLAVPIAFLNEINNLAIVNLLNQPKESEQLIGIFINLHHHGIIIAQVFWGLWLFPLGYLIYKSEFLPKFIGVLLIIGSIGYVVDSFTLILLPNFKITFSEFTFLGEVIFPLWLLTKGININKTFNSTKQRIMKRIPIIILLLLVSNNLLAQENQDSLQLEKFPEIRFLNFEYNQSFDRRFNSKLYEQDFQEGDIKSQRNFMASINVPLYKSEKWSFTASLLYQYMEFEFKNIDTPSPTPFFERNGNLNFHNISSALNTTYFSMLFNTPVLFNASIIADANDKKFGRIRGMLGFTFIMKQTESTMITLGAIGFLDPSSQIPFIPTFSVNHHFKNSIWELDFILPQRLLFRRPLGKNGRLSLGSSLAVSEFYIDANTQAYGNDFTYSQIELKTGIIYEHRMNDYLIGTFQGGLQNFISNQSTEKGEPAKDFIYENKQDGAGYFQIGISIDPFVKKEKQ